MVDKMMVLKMGYADFTVTAKIVRERTRALLNGDDFKGVKTGFSDIDAKISGLREGELIVVGSRPYMGKTAFALNLVENISVEQKKICLYFSMKTSMQMLIERLIKQTAQVDLCHRQIANKSQHTKIEEAAERIENAPILVDDTSSLSIEELTERIRHYKAEYDLSLIVIDYLQLLYAEFIVEGYKNGTDFVLEKIKKIAIEANCPILLLSQLNRAVEIRKEHRPLLRDFIGTNKMWRYADVILFLYRDEYYNRNSKRRGIMEVIVAKDTLGYSGIVDIDYKSGSCKLSDIKQGGNSL